MNESPLIAAVLWVFAATGTAMLPMRLQMVPGLTLLVLAPVLIVWLGLSYSLWVALLALAAFLSMFRRPLTYFARKALGLPVERPDPRRR